MEDDRVDLFSVIVKLKSSINELTKKEERLLEAYTKVNRKFNEYTKLFMEVLLKES